MTETFRWYRGYLGKTTEMTVVGVLQIACVVPVLGPTGAT